MSNVTINDASDVSKKIDTFQRTEGSDTVEMQAVVQVDKNGTPVTDAQAHIFDDFTDPANYLYECWAVAGTLDSAPAWRCSRTNVATGHTQWADGGNYTQIAANRATGSVTYA